MPHPARPAEPRAPVRPRSTAARRFLDRAGYPLRRASRSIWFVGASRGVVDDALFRELLRDRGDVALVVTSSDRATIDALRERHPDDIVAATPAPRGLARFVARLHPCAVVLRDDASILSPSLLARLRAARVPIVDLRGAAIDGAKVAALRDLLPPPEHRSGFPTTWQVASLRDRIGQSAPWKAVAPFLMRRRIDDWDELRDRLARPRSILCLGNGPSSEDPRLATVEHDCLFRMNWRWRERGFLARPDVVFAGTPDTFRHVPPCIFGLWSVRLEHAMLLRRLVTCGPAPMTYFTVERLSPLAAEARWPARPTNGALAILSAVALRPERIVVGGFDLFSHADGRYPGDSRSRNDYASPHRPDVELDLIEVALRDFRGEVVILSDILREQLAHRRQDRHEA